MSGQADQGSQERDGLGRVRRVLIERRRITDLAAHTEMRQNIVGLVGIEILNFCVEMREGGDWWRKNAAEISRGK